MRDLVSYRHELRPGDTIEWADEAARIYRSKIRAIFLDQRSVQSVDLRELNDRMSFDISEDQGGYRQLIYALIMRGKVVGGRLLARELTEAPRRDIYGPSPTPPPSGAHF